MTIRTFSAIGVLAWAASAPIYAQPAGPRSSCPGDVDEDGRVTLYDLATLLASYGTCSGDQGFNPAADLSGSGCVDLGDLTILLGNYGTVCADIVADFNNGILTVTGNDDDNTMVVSRDAAGNILVNGGAV